MPFRAWIENDGTVYLGSRRIADRYKVSLHPSGPWTIPPGGDWRIAFTHEYATGPTSILPADKDRRTKFSPAEIKPGLWRAFTLFVPASAVAVPSYGGVEKKRHIWIPAPPPDHVVLVGVFVTDARAPVNPGGRMLGYFGTGGPAVVPLTTVTRPIKPGERKVWEGDLPRMVANAEVNLRSDEPADYRGLVVVGIDDGTKGWVDLLVAQKGGQK
ncbi:MAG: hypothetical protein WEB06_10540 [Actinomycetota bacterium]